MHSDQAIYHAFKAELDFMCDGGSPAHWRQEAYRSNFYSMFAEGHPLGINGDMVRMAVRRMIDDTDRCREDKHRIMEEVCDAWDEWAFARSQPMP